MSRLVNIKNVVQDMIDQGITSVEQVHRTIADLPFDMLEKIEPLAPAVRASKTLRGNSVSSVYEIIRRINKEVGKQTETWLAGIDSLIDERRTE